MVKCRCGGIFQLQASTMCVHFSKDGAYKTKKDGGRRNYWPERQPHESIPDSETKQTPILNPYFLAQREIIPHEATVVAFV